MSNFKMAVETDFFCQYVKADSNIIIVFLHKIAIDNYRYLW